MSFQLSKGLSNVLKAFSAILVMIAHYCNVKAGSGETLNFIETIIRSQGGNIGVAIFFFLSGYGLMKSEQNSHLSFPQFFRKRFLKVYLPVLLVTLIWMPIAYNLPSSDSIIDFSDIGSLISGGGCR